MYKKIIVLLLSLALLCAAAPAALATVIPGENLTEALSTTSPIATDNVRIAGNMLGGSVVTDPDNPRNIIVTFGADSKAVFSPANPSIGRDSDAWWVGVNILKPQEYAGVNASDMKYRKTSAWQLDQLDDANTTWTNQAAVSWDDAAKTRMGCWPIYQPWYFNRWGYDFEEDSVKKLYYRYRFDWDNDGTDDQQVTLVITDQIQYDYAGVAAMAVNGQDEMGFSTIQGALARATDGWTVKLVNDVELPSTLTVATATTLDLNGHTLTGSLTVNAPGKEVSIKDSSEEQTGRLVNTGVVATVTDGTLDIRGGTLESDGTLFALASGKSINLEGGCYRGSLPNTNVDRFLIQAGYFTEKPDRSLIIQNKGAVASDKAGYAWMIGDMEANNVDSTVSATPVVPTKAELPSTMDGVTDSDKDAAIVSASSTEVDSSSLAAAAAAQAAHLTQDQANALVAKSEDAASRVNLFVQTFVDVVPTVYEAQKLTLDITPKFQIVATSETNPNNINIGVNADVVQEPQKLTGMGGVNPVSVKVKLPTGFVSSTAETVYVNHNGVSQEATVTQSTDFYIEFIADGFSEFEITKAGPVAQIGDVKYSNFTDVAAAVRSGQIVLLLQNPTADDQLVLNGKNAAILLRPTTGLTIDPENIVTNGSLVAMDDGSYMVVPQGAAPIIPDTPDVPDKPSKPDTIGLFEDVLQNDWFSDSVVWAVKGGVTSGVTDTLFAPYRSCTRKEAVTFLWRAAGRPEPETTVCPFGDIPQDAYYRKAVIWGCENRIVAGMSDTSFGPDLVCNRAQVVSFLWRYNGRRVPSGVTNPFMDVQEGDWYRDAVLWATASGVTNGMSDTSFGPKVSCNRAHIVTFLYNNANQ